MKANELVQVRWRGGSGMFEPYVSYPGRTYKVIRWVGEVPFPDPNLPFFDAEWECRVVGDTRADRDHGGELTLAFVRPLVRAWAYWPTSPMIYGCQRVEAVYAVGRDIVDRRKRVPTEIAVERDRRNAAYDALVARAIEDLRPIAARQDQYRRGSAQVAVSLPGLEGHLYAPGFDTPYSRFFRVNGQRQLIRRWEYRSPRDPDSPRLRDELFVEVVVASGFSAFPGPGFQVVDWEAAVRDLGEPRLVPGRYPQRFSVAWKLGAYELEAELESSAMQAARQSVIGPLLAQREMEWAEAHARYEVEVREEAVRRISLEQASKARERELAARVKPPPPEGPVTLDGLKARFNRR